MSRVMDLAKMIARRAGYDLVRQAVRPFGQDVLNAISSLSRKRKFRCVFDVGANDGSTAKVLLSSFPAATVYSFEPHPETFEILQRSVADARARLFNLALSEKACTTEMFCYSSD